MLEETAAALTFHQTQYMKQHKFVRYGFFARNQKSEIDDEVAVKNIRTNQSLISMKKRRKKNSINLLYPQIIHSIKS